MSGVELILGVTGLALALPGLVQTMVHFIRHLANKSSSIPDSDDSAKLKDRILDLQHGTLKKIIESVGDLYADTSDDSLRRALQRIVVEAHKKMVDLDKAIDEIMKTNVGEKHLRTQRENAQKSLDEIESLTNDLRAHIQFRTLLGPLPSRFQLRPSRFSFLDGTIAQLPHTPVQACLGESRTGGSITQSRYIVEDKRLGDNSGHSIIELSTSLEFKPKAKGVLHLEGYQEVSPGVFRLAFKFPKDRANPRSLRDILLDPINTPVPRIPRNYRFILPRKLAEAVYHVHEQRLVHKCIRPESILLFHAEGNGPEVQYPKAIGMPVLTDWQHFRKIDETSRHQALGDWTMGVYQHPERQTHPATQPASRYHIGHDIYSLGICLLEIGLWHSFITYDERGTKTYSPLLAEAKAAWRAENAMIDPDGQPLSVAEIDKEFFIHLAGDRLAFEMGEAYSKLVVKCLTCLERGFGNTKKFVDSTSPDWDKQGFCFIQQIREELTGASTMGQGRYNSLA